MKFFPVFAILTMLLLGGCKKEVTVPSHVVTQIDISCQQEDVHIRRHYTNPEKMEKYLIYLRLLELKGAPEADPETVDAHTYEITVQLSDGRQKRYRQKDHRYWSCQTQPWQTIDPAQASELYRLMRTVPEDLPL